MNSGAFGENFPYTNFHDLNMDWIIKIAKDFLDQYSHIQETITEGLEGLDTKANELEALLQEWYNTHSRDIANQLANALNDLEDWYDTHSEDIANQLSGALTELDNWYQTHRGYLDQYLSNSITAFNQAADNKAAETIATIPSDYTAIANNVDDLNEDVSSIKEYVGYTDLRYTGGYELGRISQTTGGNNTSTTRVRTKTFLDNTHVSSIIISSAIQMQVFEYMANGTYNSYYVNFISTSPTLTHNAIGFSNGVLTIQPSTQYKYRLNWLYYPNETTITDVDAFVQANISITYTDAEPIPNVLTELRSDVAELKNPQIQKTWACYGDSLTQMDLYENTVRNMLGITTLYRRGIIGCTIAINSASAAVAGENSSICYRIINRINFPDNPDIITILGGINDYMYGSPLGDMNSTDTSTVYGALRAICENLAMLSYNPKIAFITPTKKIPGQAPTAIDNTVTQEQIRQAVIDVAGAYGYPVIDLGGTCGINIANVSRATNPTTTDGTHWSEVGQAMCVPIIADGIRALYQK